MAKVNKNFNVNITMDNGNQPDEPTQNNLSETRSVITDMADRIHDMHMQDPRSLYRIVDEERGTDIGPTDTNLCNHMQAEILNRARRDGISIDEARQQLVDICFGTDGTDGAFAHADLLEGDENMPIAERISATAMRYLGFGVSYENGRVIAPTYETEDGFTVRTDSIDGTDQLFHEKLQDRILEIALENNTTITEARQHLVETCFGAHGNDGAMRDLLEGENWLPMPTRVQMTAERYLGFDVQMTGDGYVVEPATEEAIVTTNGNEPTEPEVHTSGELVAESVQNMEQHMQNVSQSVAQAVGSANEPASSGSEGAQINPDEQVNAMNSLMYGKPDNQPIRDYFQNRMFQMCSEEGISIDEAANRMVEICFGEHGDDGLFGQNGMLLGDETMDLASRVSITSHEYLGFGTNIGLDGNLHPLNVAANLNNQYNHLLEQYPAIAQAEAVLGSSAAAYFGLNPAVGYAAVNTMNQMSQGVAQATQSMQDQQEQSIAEEALQADSEESLNLNEILQSDSVHNSDRPMHTPMANGIPAKVTEPESSDDRSKDTGIELE